MSQTTENLLPAITGQDLGSSTQQWDGFFNNLTVYGALILSGASATFSGTLTGNVVGDVTGNVTSSGTSTFATMNLKNLNQIRFATRYAGASTAAKVTAAAADFAGGNGLVVVTSDMASGDISGVLVDGVEVLDLRGTGAINLGGYTTSNTRSINIANKSTASLSGFSTHGTVNIAQEIAAGGINVVGNKANYNTLRTETTNRTPGQHTGTEAQINDFTMGDSFSIAGLIDTSGGNVASIGDEGHVALRGAVRHHTAEMSGTITDVTGSVITIASPTNPSYIGEGRFLINTTSPYSTGTATTAANSATITEGGGADFESATTSGVLDSNSNPRWGFSLNAESASLTFVTPITAVAVGGTTATLRDAWPSQATTGAGAYKIYPGSVVTAVNYTPGTTAITLTVSDPTQFSVGNTVKLPMDNRFHAIGSFINITQQIASSSATIDGLTISNNSANAPATSQPWALLHGFTMSGNATTVFEQSGHTTRATKGLSFNTGPSPSTWISGADNVDGTLHTLIAIQRNAAIGGNATFTFQKAAAGSQEWKLSGGDLFTMITANNAAAAFDVRNSSGVPYMRVGSGGILVNNSSLLTGYSGNQSGKTWEVTTSTGLLTTYNSLSTVGAGVSPLLARTDLVTQGAAIAATTLYAVPSTGAGQYRITYVATITRAGSVSSTLGGANGFQVLFTSPTDSVVKTTPAGPTSTANTTATCVTGSIIVYAKLSTNIQYQFGYTDGGGTTMQYELHAMCEFLG